MLTMLAWKNVWRNKKRSFIIVTAIALGLWGGLLSGAMTLGMIETMVSSAIDRYISHIQIHHPDFSEEPDLHLNIQDADAITEALKAVPGVQATSSRMVINGMAASAASSFGARIVGIDTLAEKSVTTLFQKVEQGRYLGGKRRNPIIIGRKLAERLNLKLNRKLILTFQGKGGEIVYMACRVSGIFKTESTIFDQSTVFVQQSDLARVLDFPAPLIHEIAIRCNSEAAVLPVIEAIREKFPAYQLESWREVAPELAYISSVALPFTYLFVAIILTALLFGITNNMLMSVLERTRELGMLTAVGMKRPKIFVMILLETIFLAITGGIAGMLLGMVSIDYLQKTGIDLTAFSSGLESIGINSMLYPYLPTSVYFGMTIMIIITANIAAMLPAWKATHLEPVEAIRTY